MFEINEKNIKYELSRINTILITFTASNNNIINIFDTNLVFNEDYIPLITSILEKSPTISFYKQYTSINNITTIMKTNFNKYNKSVKYPSLYNDINVYNELNKSVKIEKKNILGLQYNDKENYLIRYYNNQDGNDNTDFTNEILDEAIYKKISWEYDWGNFEILINQDSNYIQNVGVMATYHINIKIIEENKIIKSRMDNINSVLKKIDKIKSSLIIDNNTNSFENI